MAALDPLQVRCESRRTSRRGGLDVRAQALQVGDERDDFAVGFHRRAGLLEVVGDALGLGLQVVQRLNS
jgi:hypothetical protein